MKPEELIVKLKEGVSEKTQETLDAIYKVCSEQLAREVGDFSIVTIAKLGHLRGVPKAQSMRNKTGERYRALIESFAQSSPIKDLGKIRKKDEDWIDEISSPKHRLLARIQASELKAAQQKLREIVPPSTVIEVYDNKNISIDAEHRLTGQERKALEYLLSSSFRNKWNLSETEFGELLHENNKMHFKPATIDAFRKALAYL